MHRWHKGVSDRKRETGTKAIRKPRHVFMVLAYGESPFLAGCVHSLLTQTRPSNILVATSTPNAHVNQIAQSCRLTVLTNPARTGIAADWNFALDQAKTYDLVTLAHQDDVYRPMFLEQTLEAFARGGGALCFTGYQEIDDAGRSKSSKISKVKHLAEALCLGGAREVRGLRLRAFLSLCNPLACSSVTFDLTRLREFRFTEGFASNLDWDAWWRMMIAGETFLRAPERLVARRHNHLTATAGLIADGTRAREDLVMFRRAWPWPLGEAVARLYRLGY